MVPARVNALKEWLDMIMYHGQTVTLVTPGVRPAGAATGDQKRIMTPGRAIAAGADYLVVGRPITEAADPKAAADAIQAEIARALG